MSKVGFLDKRVGKIFLQITSVISGTVSLVVIFFDIPAACKPWAALALLGILAFCYVAIWFWANRLNSIKIDIEGSESPRILRRLFSLRGLSHEEVKQVLT